MIAIPLQQLADQIDTAAHEKAVLLAAVKLLVDRIERGDITAEALDLACEAVRLVEPIDAQPADILPFNASKPNKPAARPGA